MIINNPYFQMLNEIFDNYKGPYEDLLRRIPKMFKILKEVYNDEDLCGEIRVEVNCALSYFIIEDDVITDTSKSRGYVDDLYMCAYVLNDIYEYDSSLVNKYTDYDEGPIIKNIIKECTNILGERICMEIISFTGLSRFKYLCENEGYLYENESRESTINRLEKKILDLKVLLNVITRSHNHSKSMKEYRDLFEKNEWADVVRILENLKLEEEVYIGAEEESKLDERMGQIKKEVLLSIDESIFEE